jgi:hypothetical protein
MGPYEGLFIFASAGEDIASGFTLKMQHSDTEDGTFTDVVTFPATTSAKSVGDVLVKHPVPFGVKNWVRFSLSAAKKTNIILTRDVDKWIPGIVK